MHFAPTDEQLQVRDAVRALLRDACPPSVVRRAWTERDVTLWPRLAESGVLGIDVPEEAGGMGLTADTWVGVLEEAGRAAAPVPLIEAVACARWLADVGETDLAADLVDGSRRVTLGVEGGLVLDADVADVVLLVRGEEVVAVRAPAVEGATCVDGALRPFRVTGGERAPLAGDGRLLLDRAAVAAASTLVGLGERMLELAVGHARQRHQFGRPVGSFQAVQHHLVDALLELRFAEPAVAAAAFALAEDLPTRRRDVAVAKSLASDAAWLAGRKSLQVHGAIGYTFEYDLHLWMKRAWVLCAAWGSASDHREALAVELLDSPQGSPREPH